MSVKARIAPSDIGEAVGLGVLLVVGILAVASLLTAGAKGVVTGLSGAKEEPEGAKKGV